jgi:phage terminase large subunit-like protein
VDYVTDFAGTLRNPTNADQAYQLMPWQYRETAALFGWRRPDGRRRFSRLNCWMPKKNGKTSWLAFLNLLFFLANGEPRPECYAASVNVEQIEDLYRESKAMLKNTAWQRQVRFTDYRKLIRLIPRERKAARGGGRLKSEGGRFRCITCSAEGAEGLKGSLVTLDEIHATLARNPQLYGSLRYAGSGRKDPLTATISTAGDNQQTLAYEIYLDAKRVLAGEVVDLETLAIVYECPDKDEYSLDEMLAANPGVGYVLSPEQLQTDYESARQKPYEWEIFKRYRLSVWTKRAAAWLNISEWQPLARPTQDLEQFRGRRAWLGVDLSGSLDLTNVTACIEAGPDTDFYLPHFWLPKDGIDRRSIGEIDYRGAARNGWITLCPGALVDYAEVARYILLLRDAMGLEIGGVGFDPHKALELAQLLEHKGLTCVKIKQGWNMSEPSLKLESQIKAGRALHSGNPIMSMCVQNVQAIRDGNAKVRPVKPTDAKKRIDGVVGAIMAKYLAMFADAGIPPEADDQLAKLMERY